MRSIDVDGVILNFHRHIYEFHGMEMPTGLTQWDQPEVWELWRQVEHNHQFWQSLPPMADPNDLPDFDYYITAIPEHLKESRILNLKNCGFPDKPVIAVQGSKLNICLELGVKMHVDDKHETVMELNSNGVFCYKFKPPYMNELPTIFDIYTLKELKINKHWNR